ncbi:hypothetical protein [Bordetella flabilis]|uniref:Uncharacterized protein n=1 Tax=Bordetella flabilis TaxID=463014 RepID=A0A193GBC1_9BORD|nr:hypothetical protein [Bordetella flabilis]ANN76756.1 hypothetical protein BAU07_06200 [Bordetella flabilis]
MTISRIPDSGFSQLINDTRKADDMFQQNMNLDAVSVPDYLAYQDIATSVQVRMGLKTTETKWKGSVCKEVIRNCIP